MKVIKPLNQGVLFRVFEDGRRSYFAVTILHAFPFSPAASLLIPEVDMWKAVAAELGKDAILDAAMPKSRAEVLLCATCFAPKGKPVPAYEVSFRLGTMSKDLFVFGDRYWKKRAALLNVISDPEPFLTMPITWDRAFGGPDSKWNPAGKGLDVIKLKSGETARPLPNIEDPKHLIGSPRDNPRPAGFRPIDLLAPARMAKAGTYDEDWRAERFPGLAKDMDPAFFNDAPEDQQQAGWFIGDEKFELKGLHPEKNPLPGKLPGLRPRLFLNQKEGVGERFKEINTHADTVWLFPRVEMGIVIHRGVVEVASDEAADVLHLMTGYERLADPPRDLEHYRRTFLKKTDPATGAVAMIDERDLIPPGEPSPIIELMKDADTKSQESPRRQNLMRKLAKDRQQQEAMITAAGLDPATVLPPPPPPPKPLTVDDVLNLDEEMQKAQAAAKIRHEELLQNAKDTMAQLGLDYDQMVAEAKKKAGPRPVFKAEEQIAEMRAAGVADPDMEAKLRQTEEVMKKNYRSKAHFTPEPILPPPEQAARLREQVIAAIGAGQSLAGQDLLGADLHGLDLRNLDFTNAFLEKVNLNEADLSGATLDGAVLAWATLDRAKLVEASLVAANFGAASLLNANLNHANLQDAVLAGANLFRADFTGANLAGADFLDAKCAEADFAAAVIGKATFSGNDFTGAIFKEADLSASIWIKCTVSRADFTAAKAPGAVFVGLLADHAVFAAADLTKSCAADGCVFTNADLKNANLTEAGWLAADLSSADLRGAVMAGANFYESKLRRADLTLAVAPKARFDKADLSHAKLVAVNLMEGSLLKARLTATNLSGANLFGAELFRAVIGNTNFTGADLTMTKLEKWRPA
jgi:uncharacterized protein YjbI with pentapeptide repeats